MIAFFTQNAFAAASGNSNLPNGLVIRGRICAIQQLGLEILAVIVVSILYLLFRIYRFVVNRISNEWYNN